MQERDFVDALIETTRKKFPNSTVVRPSDNYSLGIPDLLIWIPLEYYPTSSLPAHERCRPWAVAIEAKSLKPLMPDPFHKGRRTGLMLEHNFTGPQISLLRSLARSQVDAFGLVRASEDTAFRIHPEDIPAKNGNFTYDEMIAIGQPIRRVKGVWQFWDPAPKPET